jgi:hypothetical protein
MHDLHGASRGVVLGLHRQVAGDAGDGADSHFVIVDSPDSHPVADLIHGVTQNVESDADIGNGGWREGGDVAEHGVLVIA